MPEFLIDTHTHLVDASFDEDRDDVLARAAAAGVKAIVAVAENCADAEKALALSQRYPQLLPAAGLHPDNPDPDEAARVVAFIHEHHQDLRAIGEVGLDYWKIKGDEQRAVQRRIFADFVALSLQYDLPLNVHSRSAGHYTLDLLLEHGAKKVQMHAFDGKASKALPGVEAGFFFSIPASIVRSRQKQKLVQRLPLTSLLVETDSPVLAPEQGQRNEPANLPIAVQAIAEIKGVSRDEVSEILLANTQTLYGPI